MSYVDQETMLNKELKWTLVFFGMSKSAKQIEIMMIFTEYLQYAKHCSQHYTAILWGMYIISFVNENTEVERLNNGLRLYSLSGGRAAIWTRK